MTSHHNNVAKTAFLLVGEMAGGGVLGLPAAVAQAGVWPGLALLVISGLMAGFTGTVLGWCFQLATESGGGGGASMGTPLLPHSAGGDKPAASDELEENQDEYKHYPYIYIGRRACGRGGEVLVFLSQMLTLFGVSVVFLLLSAENLNGVWPSVSLHTWLVVCALVVLPLTWLQTPKDFWGAAVAAVLCTAVVAYGVTVQSAVDAPSTFPGAPPASFSSFFSAYGTVVFAFGGGALFPTLMVDMQDPRKFGRAVAIGFCALFAMYIPVAAAGYFAFGREVGNNVLSTKYLSSGAANAFRVIITGHLLTAVILIANPISQLVEHYVRLPERAPGGGWACTMAVPHGFNVYRVVIRSAQLAVVWLLARVVPNADFLWVQSLIGGFSTTMLTFIFPSTFYLALRVRDRRARGAAALPLVPEQWILHALILVVAGVAGVSSIRSAWLSRPF